MRTSEYGVDKMADPVTCLQMAAGSGLGTSARLPSRCKDGVGVLVERVFVNVILKVAVMNLRLTLNNYAK